MARSNLIPLVLRAWEELPDGVHEDFHGHRIVKLPKILLLVPPLQQWRDVVSRTARKGILGEFNGLTVLAFPRPEHIVSFEQAAKGVRAAGPASIVPGAIGTLRVGGFERSGSPEFVLSMAQAHFKTGKGAGFLPRTLATRYAGWRKHALSQVLKLLHKEGVSLGIHMIHLYPQGRTLYKVSPFHNEVLSLGKELGFKVEDKLRTKEDRLILRHP